MATVVEIAGLPEDKMLDELKKKPYEFFKQLKHLPDSIASNIYKELDRRWKETETRIKILEDLDNNLNWNDDNANEDRYDTISELLKKALQGFDIKEEHENRKIPIGHRLVLEARLLERVNLAFNIVEAVFRNFYVEDADWIKNERRDVSLETRILDTLYAEVHTSFLKSYLDMDW